MVAPAVDFRPAKLPLYYSAGSSATFNVVFPDDYEMVNSGNWLIELWYEDVKYEDIPFTLSGQTLELAVTGEFTSNLQEHMTWRLHDVAADVTLVAGPVHVSEIGWAGIGRTLRNTVNLVIDDLTVELVMGNRVDGGTGGVTLPIDISDVTGLQEALDSAGGGVVPVIATVAIDEALGYGAGSFNPSTTPIFLPLPPDSTVLTYSMGTGTTLQGTEPMAITARLWDYNGSGQMLTNPVSILTEENYGNWVFANGLINSREVPFVRYITHTDAGSVRMMAQPLSARQRTEVVSYLTAYNTTVTDLIQSAIEATLISSGKIPSFTFIFSIADNMLTWNSGPQTATINKASWEGYTFQANDVFIVDGDTSGPLPGYWAIDTAGIGQTARKLGPGDNVQGVPYEIFSQHNTLLKLAEGYRGQRLAVSYKDDHGNSAREMHWMGASQIRPYDADEIALYEEANITQSIAGGLTIWRYHVKSEVDIVWIQFTSGEASATTSFLAEDGDIPTTCNLLRADTTTGDVEASFLDGNPYLVVARNDSGSNSLILKSGATTLGTVEPGHVWLLREFAGSGWVAWQGTFEDWATSSELTAAVDSLRDEILGGVGAGGNTLFELDARLAVFEAMGSLATDAELVALTVALINGADSSHDTFGELAALLNLRLVASNNLSDVANKLTSFNTLLQATSTTIGRSLLSAADAAALRTITGSVIGVDVQGTFSVVQTSVSGVQSYGVPGTSFSTITSQSGGANVDWYTFFPVERTITVIELGVNLAIGAAGSFIHFGLVEATSGRRINSAALFDSGLLSSATAGLKSATGLSIPLTPGVYAFICGSDSATVTFRCSIMSNILSTELDGANSATVTNNLQRSQRRVSRTLANFSNPVTDWTTSTLVSAQTNEMIPFMRWT